MPEGQRIFAVGDIHGCAVELQQLLALLRLTANDRIVFLGDYVDRGPASRHVIDIVIALQSVCEVVALKGNHEAMFLDFLNHPESVGAGLFVLNGGGTTLLNYEEEDGSIEMPESHVQFLNQLKLYYETPEYFFVHAGVPDIPLASLSGPNSKDYEMHMLWSRQPFLSSKYKWEKLVIHGHTPVQQYEVKENRINLDTGCVYDGKLTAVELSERRFYQVDRDPDAAGQHLIPKEFDPARISMRYYGRLVVRARRGQEPEILFETLNYNQFGLLMHEKPLATGNQAASSAKNFLGNLVGSPNRSTYQIGDVIEGQIGDRGDQQIEFTGEVVRLESRSGTAVYGVRIDRLKSDSGNTGAPAWIERPKKG